MRWASRRRRPTASCSIHADGSQALRALWRHLDAAQQSIDLCTFILGRDHVGQQVIDKLCEKARAGVRVRLLLDGMGSLMAGRPNLKPLRAAGASVALFVPPLHSPLKGRTNLRDHRKMLIVDAARESRRLWSGGRNLASEYFEGEPGKAAWHDLSFDLEGPLVLQALALFERDWAFANTERAPQEMPAEGGAEAADAPAYGAQLVASGPDQVDDTVYALLLSAAYQARRRIALVDAVLRARLGTADGAVPGGTARRGGGTADPARSNHRLSDIARGRALRALAQAGARIWLAPQMLHAKLAVIDDQLALAGSANFDSRSLFLNYEMMIAFHEGDDVRAFGAWYERERQSASPMPPRNRAWRATWPKAWCCGSASSSEPHHVWQRMASTVVTGKKEPRSPCRAVARIRSAMLAAVPFDAGEFDAAASKTRPSVSRVAPRRLFRHPNPWDAGSAKALAGLGFAALATSSGACRRRAGPARRRDHARRGAGACPRHCRGHRPAGGRRPGKGLRRRARPMRHVTIRRAGECGLVGGSIEDCSGLADAPAVRLQPRGGAHRRGGGGGARAAVPVHADRALRELPARQPRPGRHHRAACRPIEQAGADVLFAPALPDLAAVRAVCAAVDKPVNFMVGRKGASFSVAELRDAGVRRISLATSLYRAAMAGLMQAAGEVRQGGFGYVDRL